jgi:hypothetical protein
MLQYRRGIGADVGAMRGCPALQGAQIPHRIDRHLGGQVGGIGVAAPRTHHWVDLDQLTAPIQFHRVRIHAGIETPQPEPACSLKRVVAMGIG